MDDLMRVIEQSKRRRRLLPILWKNDALRLWTLLLWDCSYVEVSLTTKHGVSVLKPNHRKWWQPPVCGISVWY